jgi:hypothetical protein
MVRKTTQSLRRNFRMLADQAKQVVVFFRAWRES